MGMQPMGGGMMMGGGMPMGIGGMMAPPPPPMFGGMGMLIGAELIKSFMEAQQRQAQLQQQLKVQQELGADSAKIAELQRMLSEQNAKVDALAAQKSAAAQVAPPDPVPGAAPSEAQLQLQLEVLKQQKELELVKQGSK